MSSPLLTCQNLTKSFGSKELFEDLSFSLPIQSKVALVGPNGSGKSTLLKIIGGLEKQEKGEVIFKQGLKVGFVPQHSSFPAKSIRDIMKERGGDSVKIETLISQFNLPDTLASELSGGWQKKLDLALALLHDPDLLVLDEPTNHLDLESIKWLEGLLKRLRKTILFTSHDRSFLQSLATHTLELNSLYPEGLFFVEGDFKTFQERKALYLEQLKDYQQALSSKVRREEAWLRTTPQARTTKAKSRIDQAERLIQELHLLSRRTKEKKLAIEFSSTERETRKLLQAKNISKSLQGKTLFAKLDLILSPRLKIGLVGPNGSGKSTLLKVLAGELAPDTGSIKLIDGLKIVYFDQERARLPLHLTVKEALSPHTDSVTFQGRNMHVNSWGKKFFFTPEQMGLPLSHLSGGERARLTIARLMLEPADLLFLDEPTNDLDIETLEVLEESLETFPGAIVLISHDRTLIDRTCDRLIALDIPGFFCEDLHQYERMKKPKEEASPATPKTQKAPNSPLKISYKEKYEYEELTKKIASLETDISELKAELQNDLDLKKLQELHSTLEKKEADYETAFFRWHELDEKITK